MAVTAKFSADFSDFTRAVESAQIELRTFEDGAGKVESALTRMTNNFSGVKVVQDAALMAEAVERIGGVSKLTETELEKLSAKASEAVAKMTALGVDIPPKLQALADAAAKPPLAMQRLTEDTTSSVEEFARGIPVVGEFIAALSAEKVLEFASATLEAAGRVEDLSRATGLSTKDFQALSFVGKEFGVDAEVMARGVEQLSAKLANGDSSAVAAVGKLGLSVDALIASGPKEAFLEVADATGRIEDPMLKNALATDEFGGRLAKVLIPALGELREKMDAVPRGSIISEQNVVTAHELDVAWTHLKDTVGVVFTDLIVRTAEAFGAQTAAMREATKAADEHHGADVQLISSAEALANRLNQLRTDAMRPLTDEQKTSIVVLQSYGVTQKEIAQLLSTSGEAVHRYTEGLKEQEKAVKEAAAAVKQWDDTLDHMAKETFKLAQEHEKEWREQSIALTERTNAALLAEFNAQTQLNAAMGLNAAGAIKIQNDALDTLNAKLTALHLNKVEGISQEKQEAVLMQEYTDALLKEAQAQDAVADATADTVTATKAADDQLKAFRGTVLLDTNDLKTLNKELSSFYDQLAKTGGVGSFAGSSGVGQPRVPGAGSSIAPDFASKGDLGGAGVSLGDIHIHGNVDSPQTARDMANQVTDQVMDRLQRNTKVPLTRSAS